MIAKLKNTRDENSQNPLTILEIDGMSFTFPGTDKTARADAVLQQYGYKKMWKNWKRVGGNCNHPDCRAKSYLRTRVIKVT